VTRRYSRVRRPVEHERDPTGVQSTGLPGCSFVAFGGVDGAPASAARLLGAEAGTRAGITSDTPGSSWKQACRLTPAADFSAIASVGELGRRRPR
jgi:hypothetical protein